MVATRIASLQMSDDPEADIETLSATLGMMGTVSIVARLPNYIRAEARSRFFRFFDDMEFLMCRERGVIYVHYSAQFSVYNLGTYRRNIKYLRTQFDAIRDSYSESIRPEIT